MKCPECQAENPQVRKFCRECGSKLLLVCSQCGSENRPEDKFCGECGSNLRKPAEARPIDYYQPQSYTPKFLADKILTTRASIEGERKLVTVLFADVANYTAMSERLDPEEVHRIMDGCFKILMDEIHRYDGTINQFTGDGVMALFGAPLAHEDHPQRACYAALSIQKAMGGYGEEVKKDCDVEFKMRIGLNTGLVIVGSIGDDLRMDYTAVGDTTNLAARIQASAKAGEVWMSRETRTISQDYIQNEPVGELPLKGKAEPQPVYRVISERPGVHTRFEAGLRRGMTELVGRHHEMEVLRGAFEKAKIGEAQVVDVVGEAGIGKSRLVYEFQKAFGSDMAFLTGFCVHYGRNINFLPVRDLVKAAFDIEEGMTEKGVGNRIEEKATEGLSSMIPFYRSLLSLEVDDPGFNALNPEGRKFGTFEAVKKLLLALSKGKPLVVLLEDVHWMDKLSEEFFAYFFRCILDNPILMIASYRPEGSPTWAQGTHYQRLGLETLSTQSSSRVVRNILGGVGLDPDLEQKIVEKTEGNPFFIEEIVRELLDRGDLLKADDQYICARPLDQCEIPNTVQGVLAARMDRLGEDLKRTMQVASVIGRDFAFQLLKSIMELGDELRAHLTNLVGLEILYEKALYPELEYIFKHALTQEVAYESLLKQRRRELHGRIARAIEELYADKLEQHYELLAHHWGLSDSPDRSIDYLVLAGEKSNRTQAASSAVDFFTRALNQTEKLEKAIDPKLLMRIRSGRANPLSSMGKVEESLEDFQEAICLGRELGDQQTVLDCLAQLPFLLYNTALKNKVPSLCEEGLELARTLQDKSAEARIMASYAYWRYLWQRTEEYETFQEALKLAKQSGKPPVIFFIHLMLSLQERWRGNPRQSLKYSEGMVEMLQSVFSILLGSSVSIIRGWALTDLGKYNEAIEFQSEWIDILERNSIYPVLGRVYNGQGWTYSEVYDLEKASVFNNKALKNAISLRKSPALVFTASEMLAMSEVNLMENKFEMGMIDEAWEHIIRFEEVSTAPAYDLHRDRWSTRMKEMKGNILLSRGEIDDAEQIALECLDVVSKRRYNKYIAKSERLLGRILTVRGACDQAEVKLKEAVTKLEAVGNPKQLWITHTALARLYKRMKRPDLEREQWLAAAKVAESTADGLQEKSLRTTFVNAAPIREIMEYSNR